MNKQELRSLYLKKRSQVSKQEYLQKSEFISTLFFDQFQPTLLAASFLHLFLPIESKREINTRLIFKKLISDFPNLKIALSKSNFDDCSMTLLEYSEKTFLKENSYGIPEPENGEIIHPAKLDVILIPMLIGDRAGNRIGYGKGFYDRLLAQCDPTCLKIGLCIEEPIEAIEPDKHDIPIDYCITPLAVYSYL